LSSHLAGAESTPQLAQSDRYVGRFAPSPTGPLHFGSLLAAVASYLQAKVARGKWLVRMEDLDTPRVAPGAADDILRTLAAFGFEWDGAVTFQSQRLDHYAAAIAALSASGQIYACSCSRAQIAAHYSASEAVETDELSYPGTCRHRHQPHVAPTALRFRVPTGVVTFLDRIQGIHAQDVAATSGDFVVRRRDGIYAYHLAVVVDDDAQGVTEVVRGADLLNSTPRQILLQQAFAYPRPAYAHIPLAVDAFGNKLSKSAQSLPIHVDLASSLLWKALQTLSQSPPEELHNASLRLLWDWAFDHWSASPLAGHLVCPAPPVRLVF
jgi:glutamyl-Q tRNA(Asp) synthetase